jgi:hypothetical protein
VWAYLLHHGFETPGIGGNDVATVHEIVAA